MTGVQTCALPNLMDAAFYVPCYRIMESAEPEMEIQRAVLGRVGGLTAERKLYKLKGSKREVQNVFENMKQWQTMMFTMGARNHKMLQTIDTGRMLLPKGSIALRYKAGPNTVMVYRHGKQEYYQMGHPLYMHAFMGVQSVTSDYLDKLTIFNDGGAAQIVITLDTNSIYSNFSVFKGLNIGTQPVKFVVNDSNSYSIMAYTEYDLSPTETSTIFYLDASTSGQSIPMFVIY